jgi:hypothetical protein
MCHKMLKTLLSSPYVNAIDYMQEAHKGRISPYDPYVLRVSDVCSTYGRRERGGGRWGSGTRIRLANRSKYVSVGTELLHGPLSSANGLTRQN